MVEPPIAALETPSLTETARSASTTTAFVSPSELSPGAGSAVLEVTLAVFVWPPVVAPGTVYATVIDLEVPAAIVPRSHVKPGEPEQEPLLFVMVPRT